MEKAHTARSEVATTTWRPSRIAALAASSAMIVAIGITSSAPVTANGPDCTTVCYVAPGGSNANGGASPSDAKATIQAAVNAVSPGGTVIVAPGTYTGNVTINNKSLTLRSTAGRSETTIIGQVGATLGTIDVRGATTGGVTIGGEGAGFRIVGVDNPSAGIEWGAVHLSGTHSDVTIADNEIVAVGEYGLLAEAGATISGLVIDDNVFAGQTFVGANPAGNGFGQQFTLANVPRQLVRIGSLDGQGISGLQFTNNAVVGTAGGFNTAFQEQGNTLVTLDAGGAVITGNTFAGTTSRQGVHLQVRNSDVTVERNTFSASSLIGTDTGHVLAQGADVRINQNNLAGSTRGVQATGGDVVDATCNWWGAANGPSGLGDGSGSTAEGNLTFVPFLISSNLDESCGPAGPPTDIVAVAGDGTAEVSWVAPSFIGSGPLTGYRVESSTDDGATWTTAIADTGSTDTSATVTGLTNGVPVRFQVAAINLVGAGAFSVPSAAVTPIVPTSEPEPTPDSEPAPGEQPEPAPEEKPEPAPGEQPQPAPVPEVGPRPVLTVVPPTRLLDTRVRRNVLTTSWGGASPVPSGTTIAIPVGGAGVPEDATAVVVNLTTTSTVEAGYLTVFACDQPRPPTSNANFAAGHDRANAAIVPVSVDGEICLYTSGTTDLIVDVFAFAGADGGYAPVRPARLADTRFGDRPTAGTTIRVPLPDGVAHSVTLTATRVAGAGYLTAHDCAEERPATSDLNVSAGEDIANLTIVTGAELCVFSSTELDILVDLHGTFDRDPADRSRLLDTRHGAPLAPGSTVEVPGLGRTAAINLTATGTSTAGYITVHSCEAPLPSTSNLNTRVGHDVANLAIAAGGGRTCITTTSATHLVVDLIAELE